MIPNRAGTRFRSRLRCSEYRRAAGIGAEGLNASRFGARRRFPPPWSASVPHSGIVHVMGMQPGQARLGAA